jgi:hypothetical protein
MAGLKRPNPTKGCASLVFHYMGDSRFTLFFQEAMKLKKAMEGYDEVVLLKFDELNPWLDFTERDERIARVVAAPTKANIAKHLKSLADRGYVIDIWIIGHGGPGSFNVSTGRYGHDEDMTKDEIAQLAKNAGYTKLPIRMVWSTLCYGGTLNDAWLKAGAKAVAGARWVNFYPTEFGPFADEWNKGNVGYGRALRASNTPTVRSLVQSGMVAHSKGCLRDWGGKVWDVNILGNGEAAKNYFTKVGWIRKKNWQDQMSGKENMNASSEKLVPDGSNTRITKGTVPTW